MRCSRPVAQGARRDEHRSGEAGGPGSSTAMGMRRFVKRTIEMWRGGFDSRRVLMAQVSHASVHPDCCSHAGYYAATSSSRLQDNSRRH